MPIIDLSGDFRLNKKEYENYYKCIHKSFYIKKNLYMV